MDRVEALVAVGGRPDASESPTLPQGAAPSGPLLPTPRQTSNSTTINSLPLESLHRILELAREPHPTRSRRTLAAASLVARRWREPAQALMWLHLDIRRRGIVQRLRESPVCGQYRTVRVALRGSSLGEDETVEGAVDKLRGIHWLELSDCGWKSYHFGWLSLPSLQDLKTLNIEIPFNHLVPANIRPSFRLRTLTLRPSTTSAALNRTILHSSSSSLLSLTLHLPRGESEAHLDIGILSSLLLVRNRLPSLSLHGAVPGLGPILSTFTSLNSLTLHIYSTNDFAEYDTLLAHLTTPVPSLRLTVAHLVCALDRGFVRDLSERMRGEAWQGVTEVRFLVSRGELEEAAEGTDFLEMCTAKVIVVKSL